MADLLENNSEHIGNMTEDFLAKEWKNWCRLCARADAEYINMISGQWKSPISAISAYSSSNILPVIEDFFRVQVNSKYFIKQSNICLFYYFSDSRR